MQKSKKEDGRMIELKVRFWTNDISPKKGKVDPKHAWTSGVVRMQTNALHGIASQRPVLFHSLLALGAAIEKTLKQQGIVLHTSRREKSYLAAAQGKTMAGLDDAAV
jgi:hypothetical protein